MNDMLRSVRVAVIDDHPIFREGVVRALSREPSIDVIAQGASASDALEIARNLSPDILLLDLCLPGGGLRAATDVLQLGLDIKIVILTASQDGDDLVEALKIGAKAYLLKGMGSLDLVRIVTSVAEGGTYIAPELATTYFLNSRTAKAKTYEPDDLSRREQDVFDKVAGGLTNKEIARGLELSEKTVKHHMTSIMAKLKVRNRVEVAIEARGRSSSGTGLRRSVGD